jgi:hypothetical protein
MTRDQLSQVLPDDPLLAEVLADLCELKARSFEKLRGLDSLTTDTASTVKVHPELDAFLRVSNAITSTLNEAGLTPKVRKALKGGGDDNAAALDSMKTFLQANGTRRTPNPGTTGN